MGDGRDASRPMDVDADVALVRRAAPCGSRSDRDRSRLERPDGVVRRVTAPRRRRERDEERVPLRVDLDAAVAENAARRTRRCSASASA